MTDNSSLIANRQGLPSNLMYNLKASAPISRALRTSVPASNASSFTSGSTIIFQVPSGRRGTYLDGANSLFRFSIQNNDVSGNAIYFDNFGASAINRIDVFCGSALLESIQGANILYSYLSDFQITPSGRAGVSTGYGFNRGGTRAGSPIYGGTTQTFAIPLLSALFMQSDKFTPIGLLADDIRIEISLEQNNLAAYYSPATTTGFWKVVSAEMELNIIELQSEGNEMVNSMTPFNEPIYISSNSYRHYVSTMQTTQAGAFSFLVPARFASTKSLIMLPRPAATMVQTGYAICSRANPMISSYFWRCGSFLLPSKPVVIQSSLCGGYAESFMQVVASFHSLGSPNQAAGLDASQYQVADIADMTVAGGFTGAIGGVQAYATGSNNL